MDLLDRLKAIGWRLADVFLSFGTEFSLPFLLVASAVAIGSSPSGSIAGEGASRSP